jgi:hypothetical protein
LDIPVGAIRQWLVDRRVGLAIGVGVILRLLAYARGRPYWMDENSLVANLRLLTPAGFFGPLGGHQLAPPGFLLATWSAIRLLGDNVYAMRLVPLLGGIGSMFLFRAVAGRCLPPRAVFAAVVMFAVASDPIYYASEVKQYSTDLAVALGITLVALRVGRAPASGVQGVALGVGGAAVVWFSHPSIFVLAGVGLVGLSRSIAARDTRGALAWCLVGLAWLASFAGVHAVAGRQLNGSPQMWIFWGFAFPPRPPRSLWDALWPVRRLVYYFINPLNFDAPFGERASMLPALGLAALGAVRLGRLDRARFALLALPLALTLMAAYPRLYPFHGRLLIFLIPPFLLAIAAGLDRLDWEGFPRLAYLILAAMVLVAPTVAAVDQAVNPRLNHSRFGDLHPDNLVDPDRFPF